MDYSARILLYSNSDILAIGDIAVSRPPRYIASSSEHAAAAACSLKFGPREPDIQA